jgi:cell division protein FtsB
MNFGKKQSANVTLRILGIEPKDKNLENVMRVSMLALAMSLVCFAAPAPAQTVIDVEGQKAVPPPAPERSKPQPPGEIQDVSQDNLPAVPPSRFTFTRVNNGFLRLDNDSGQVAYCSTQGRGWACQAASENHPALESQVVDLQDDVAALKKLETEIAALQDGVASVKKLQTEITRLRDEVSALKDEVSALKKEIVALKEPPPPRPPADLSPPADKGGDVTIKLPTREDMARASAFIQDTWRRFVDMINTVQKDMMRKG